MSWYRKKVISIRLKSVRLQSFMVTNQRIMNSDTFKGNTVYTNTFRDSSPNIHAVIIIVIYGLAVTVNVSKLMQDRLGESKLTSRGVRSYFDVYLCCFFLRGVNEVTLE
jgi:hypothetical protein